MKKFRWLLTILAVLFLACGLVACGDEQTEEDRRKDEGYGYKVTFDCNGGKSNTGQQQLYVLVKSDGSSKVGLPDSKIIARPDWTLEGWYRGSKNEASGAVTFGERWDLAKDYVTEDGIVLYAKWTRNFTYKIVVDNEVVYTLPTQPGEKFITNFEPTLTDKTFLYYCSNRDLSERWNVDFTHPGYQGVAADPTQDDTGHDVFVYARCVEGKYTKVSQPNELANALAANQDIYVVEPGTVFDFSATAWPELIQYSGTVVGNGAVIRNVNLTVKDSQNVFIDMGLGLFGNLMNASLEDLTFEHCAVNLVYTGKVTKESIVKIGFLCGISVQSTCKDVVLDDCSLNWNSVGVSNLFGEANESEHYYWNQNDNTNASSVSGTVVYRDAANA